MHITLIWLPVKGEAWLRRFDDVTRVEKSCVRNKQKKNKGKMFCYCKLICASPTHL